MLPAASFPACSRLLPAALLCVLWALPVGAAGTRPSPPATTVVSLTFDDALTSQWRARPLLARHGLKATFFVNAGRLGQKGRLTVAQLRQLAAEGHEVGGHGATHVNLVVLARPALEREVCEEREALQALGFSPHSFAYPYGQHDAEVREVVEGCGYASARAMAGLADPAGCEGCAVAESLPPADALATRTPGVVEVETTLAALQETVRRAERAGGGWVQLVFHAVCDGCSTQAVREADLERFLTWLAGRAPHGTVVRTVGEVMGEVVAPAAPLPLPSPREEGGRAAASPLAPQLLVNASLEEDADGDGTPDCWSRVGGQAVDWGRTPEAWEGRWAEALAVRAPGEGAALLTRFEEEACAVPVEAGRRYRLSAWYLASTAPRFTLLVRGAHGWQAWTESVPLPRAETWREATWETPPVPADVTAVAVGVGLLVPGTLRVDALRLVDAQHEAALLPARSDVTP